MTTSSADEMGVWSYHDAGVGEVVVYDASGAQVFHHDGRLFGMAFRPTPAP